jgi:plasmid maintenance system antidote protein VapI
MDEYVCACPVHPDEILKEDIEYHGVSQCEIAAQTGMSYKALNHILNGRRRGLHLKWQCCLRQLWG